jgi:hypothetical protein
MQTFKKPHMYTKTNNQQLWTLNVLECLLKINRMARPKNLHGMQRLVLSLRGMLFLHHCLHPWWWDHQLNLSWHCSSKRPGEYLDPCQEAAARSLKCLHRNGGDRDMCTDYFQYVVSPYFYHVEKENWTDVANRAYRDCKQQWVSVLSCDFMI